MMIIMMHALQLMLFAGVHCNQNLVWCVKIGVYTWCGSYGSIVASQYCGMTPVMAAGRGEGFTLEIADEI